MTKAEITLWHSLKGKQLLGYKFRRQHGIDFYILDLYCPELKLAIEVDGATHKDPDVRKADAKRQRHIERYGIGFLRFTDDEIFGDPGGVVEVIEQTVTALAKVKPIQGKAEGAGLPAVMDCTCNLLQ